MTDESALLTAIRESPEDDAPRLVYADWLDEHHQPERAEFIRVQIALARRDDPALRRREAELLAEHHDALAGPLAAPNLLFRFERGFPAAFGHEGVFCFLEHNRWGVMSLFGLCFYRTGEVCDCRWVRFPGDPEDGWIGALRELRSGNWNNGRGFPNFSLGRYTMSSFGSPCVIGFRIRELEYQGTLETSDMRLEVRHRLPDTVVHRPQIPFASPSSVSVSMLPGGWATPDQFTHIPNVNSFPEA